MVYCVRKKFFALHQKKLYNFFGFLKTSWSVFEGSRIKSHYLYFCKKLFCQLKLFPSLKRTNLHTQLNTCVLIENSKKWIKTCHLVAKSLIYLPLVTKDIDC